MQAVNPRNVEMIRRREKGGYCYTYGSHQAERVDAVPASGALAGLAAEGWWDNPLTISGMVNSFDGAPADVDTQLRIVYDDEKLFAAFLMQEPRMADIRALITESGVREISIPSGLGEAVDKRQIPYHISKDDHIRLLLDFENSHDRHVELFVNTAGAHLEDERVVHYAEQVYPGGGGYYEPWEQPCETQAYKGDDFWCAAFVLPWSSIGKKPEDTAMMGINAVRGRTIREMRNHVLAWVPTTDTMCAFDFDALFLDAKPLEVPEIDFGRPVLDRNRVKLKVANTSDVPLDLQGTAELTVDSNNEVFSSENGSVSVPAGETAVLELAYALDRHETSAQTLKLKITAGDDQLWNGRYFLGNHGVAIPASFPWDFPEPTPDPSPEDEDFVDKKTDYLLSRLPAFDRATTNDGAPSDFCLRSRCGKYEFNLMQPGIQREIADMIADLFADQNDRLCALSLLAHSDAFSMHIAPHVAMHRRISTLSALRLNAGHCYSRALVWLGLARELKTGEGDQRYGERAHALLVMGHVIGALDSDDGKDRYIFDPSFGTFFFRWDNTSLATHRELSEDHALVNRVLRNRLKDFVNLHTHTPIPAGPIVFPPLAPAE